LASFVESSASCNMPKEYHEPWSPTSNVESSIGSSSGRTPGGTPKAAPPLPPAVAKAAEKGTLGPDELRAVFRHIDKDKSGEISHAEMRHALWSITGTKPTKEVTQVIMADIDTDNNGVVDEDEFIEFFTTVQSLKTMREDIIHGEAKSGTILAFVNIYGVACIIATLLFFVQEFQSDNPDFGGNWGLFVFGLMSLIWFVCRVFLPLILARVSYWVPILREARDWLRAFRRNRARDLRKFCGKIKHKVLRREGRPHLEPQSPKSPMSPSMVFALAAAKMKGGKTRKVETPYKAEHYAEAAEWQTGEMPLNSFKLLGKNNAVLDQRRSFAADQPVRFIPYSRWGGDDLQAKPHNLEAGHQDLQMGWRTAAHAWSEVQEHAHAHAPALQAPPQQGDESPKYLQSLNNPAHPETQSVSRFKALVQGGSAPVNPEPDPAIAYVDQALEERQRLDEAREAEAHGPSLAERRGRPQMADLHVDTSKNQNAFKMPKMPADNEPLKNPGV